jgi:hypothetical protein
MIVERTLQAVRLLIGKGGSIINELQATSHAHIQFQNESETAPGSFGRTVRGCVPRASCLL